ncbi:phosphate transport regulator [Candidatus Scalindua japonica]|uniref:Phosphate transport regulator n=1 Tax=Candidatus Scalindua japonica TaxID=1284222 RepID=A0A286TYU8_9BACT|nr:hypothetical protein [Candidatus Scalindua japonica]GAX61057.1 phosphate transport regulator [Candidatus Scalindua japonica]
MISAVVTNNNSIPILSDTNEKSSSSSKTEALKVDLQKSKNFTINTSEGDVVTISSLEEFHTGYYSYQDITSGNGNISLQENRQLEISAEKMLTLSVEGDLSSQEIKDIKKSLKLVSNVLSGYQSGDIKKVLKNVSKIGNLDTIADLDAAMQQVSSVSYEQHSITRTAYPTSGIIEQDTHVTATHDSPTFVNQDNIIPKNEHFGHEVEDTEDNSPDIKGGVNTVSDKMVEVLKNSDVKPDKLVKSVQNSFSKFLKSFSAGNFNKVPVMEISKMIENDFYKKKSDEKENRFIRDKYLDNNIKNEEASVLNNTV